MEDALLWANMPWVNYAYRPARIEIKENRGENVNGKKQDPPGQCGQER